MALHKSGRFSRGSTWARMSRAALQRHVLAFGERLGLAEGMSVLAVGATCGHALAILQERYGNKLRAVGVGEGGEHGQRAGTRDGDRVARAGRRSRWLLLLLRRNRPSARGRPRSRARTRAR